MSLDSPQLLRAIADSWDTLDESTVSAIRDSFLKSMRAGESVPKWPTDAVDHDRRSRSIVYDVALDEFIYVDIAAMLRDAARAIGPAVALAFQPSVPAAAALVSVLALSLGVKHERILSRECGAICSVLLATHDRRCTRDALKVEWLKIGAASGATFDPQHFDGALTRLREVACVKVEGSSVSLCTRLKLRLPKDLAPARIGSATEAQ